MLHFLQTASTTESANSTVPTFAARKWNGRDCLALMLTVLASLAWSGCATMKRNPVAENVVKARQLSVNGISAMEGNRWDEAEACFSEAIRTCPADERAHRHYAELLWRKGEKELAVVHLKRSVRLSGDDPQLLTQLGEMYLANGQLELAWQQAEAAIGAQTQLPTAWALHGEVLKRRGKLDEALVSFHRALSCQPDFPAVQMAVAETYQLQGRPWRALSTIESLAASYPPEQVPPGVLFLRGIALKSLHRYEDAADALAAAQRPDFPSIDLLYHLSDAQLQSGDLGSAKLSARAALELDPDHAALRELMARIDERQRGFTAAVERR